MLPYLCSVVKGWPIPQALNNMFHPIKSYRNEKGKYIRVR